MERTELYEKFEKETGLEYFECPSELGELIPNTYVSWLEEQLRLRDVGSTLTDKEKIDYSLQAKKKMSEDNDKGWLAALIYTMVLFIVGYNLLKWFGS